MRYNTSIDFIQPSGGNLDHVNHVKLLSLGDGLKPEGSSPVLPKGNKGGGSVWFRPNDGQMEHLEYQGEDTLFQTRVAEGYAAYTSDYATRSTPLDVDGTTRVIMTINSIILQDSHFFSNRFVSGGDIICHVSGLYRVSCSFRCDNTGGDGELTLSMQVNGVDVTVGKTYVASSSDGGGCHVSLNFVGKLIPNDEIGFFPTTDIAVGDLIMQDFCAIFELIRPLDLGAGSNIIP